MGDLANPGRAAAMEKMQAAGAKEEQIQAFLRAYDRLLSGERGLVGDEQLNPVQRLPQLDALLGDNPARSRLSNQIVILKLNGGLGTSMGLHGPKSLLTVREGLTFLEIVVRQTRALRQRLRGRFPLVLMNSFSTHEDIFTVMKDCDLVHGQSLSEHDLRSDPYCDSRRHGLPWELMQSRIPKIDAASMLPVSYPQDPSLEWCPPGHGDLYLSLYCSGLLKEMIEQGYRYMFVSNVDNLGAVVDMRIPSWMNRRGIPFVMEVARRCETDRKGGHLARTKDGRWLLREVAMCPPEDIEKFQDISLYSYFNTNSLWVSLGALWELLVDNQGCLNLPLIVNRKHVNPVEETSPWVYQLETAMGAAIGSFAKAEALDVPRTRFAPVKSVSDLASVRSDAYDLTNDYTVRLSVDCQLPPKVEFDRKWVKYIGDLEVIFPKGTPSLVACHELVFHGPFVFGHNVACQGRVILENLDPLERPCTIPDDAVLSGHYVFETAFSPLEEARKPF